MLPKTVIAEGGYSIDMWSDKQRENAKKGDKKGGAAKGNVENSSASFRESLAKNTRRDELLKAPTSTPSSDNDQRWSSDTSPQSWEKDSWFA